MTRLHLLKLEAVLTAAVILICLVGSATALPRADLAQAQREMLAPVVQLGRFCSGALVHSDRDEASGEVVTLVLTAKHCTERVGQPIDVSVPLYNDDNRIVSETVYRATVVSQYAGHDLAVLRLVDSDTILGPLAAIAPADVDLYEGEDVWGVGYDAGWVRTITEGTFGQRQPVAYPDPNRVLDYFRATPATIGGRSGGPLYHRTPAGAFEVIGVTSAGRTDTNHINLFVPVNVIGAYLEVVLRLEASRLAAVR